MKLTTSINVRVSADTRKNFLRKSKQFGDPSHVLREIIEAFNDNRLTIAPPPLKGTIYHERPSDSDNS